MLFQGSEDLEDRHDCCMSMDFLQVLIHQHAKTIVALQELQSEVTTLKDFRNSVLSSLPELKQSIPSERSSTGEKHVHNAIVNNRANVGGSGNPSGSVAGSNSVAGSSAAATCLTGGTTTAGAGPDVWTSPKLIDSGFSTETNKSSPTNKSDDEDPLYSLLDLIQLKVSTTSTANHGQLHCSHCAHSCEICQPGSKTYIANAKRKLIGDTEDHDRSCCERGDGHKSFQLGRLDHVLQFRATSDELDDCSQVTISRQIIGAVLREVNVVELQRQILFGINRVKTLEARLHNLQSTTSESRLASKYLALSQENEQLRFKLKEQEIQLVGTKARLRILERLKEATAAVASVSGSSSSNLAVTAYPSGSTVTADGPNSVPVDDDKGRAFTKGYGSTVSPNSSTPPEPTPRKSKTVPSGRSSPANVILQSSYVIDQYNDRSNEEFYAAEVVPVHDRNESSTSVTNFSRISRNDKSSSLTHNVASSNHNNIVSGNTAVRISRLSNGSYKNSSKDNSINPGSCEESQNYTRSQHFSSRSNSSSPSHNQHNSNNSWGKSPQMYCISSVNAVKPVGLDKGYLNNLNSSSNSSSGLSGYSGNSRSQYALTSGTQLHRPSRIPVTTSRPNTPGKKIQPPTPPKSLSSISSKSSIPVPVTRLKRSQSSNSRNSATPASNKNKMGHFWAQWFG